jgi:hypothetical protein
MAQQASTVLFSAVLFCIDSRELYYDAGAAERLLIVVDMWSEVL